MAVLDVFFTNCHSLFGVESLVPLLTTAARGQNWQIADTGLVALLKGLDQKMDGMVNIIQEAKTRYHKKAYLAIKFLVNLFHE